MRRKYPGSRMGQTPDPGREAGFLKAQAEKPVSARGTTQGGQSPGLLVAGASYTGGTNHTTTGEQPNAVVCYGLSWHLGGSPRSVFEKQCFRTIPAWPQWLRR